MRPALFILLVFYVSGIYAQNLVSNANFEEYESCPIGISDFTTINWISPFWPGTPDYYNVCNDSELDIPVNQAGNQASSTGDAYVGIYTYGTREFIQGVLTTPTIAGATYELTLIYSPADNFGHSDGLGMLLSAGPPPSYMGQMPQMQKNVIVESQSAWHTLTVEYLSTGGETHVTIGNFNNDANSDFIPDGMYRDNAYYYIDSIAVKCIGTPSTDIAVDLGEDIVLCNSDYPITLGTNLSNVYNEWSTGETGNSIEIDNPGTYYVKSFIDCRYGTDTIIIRTIEEPELSLDETVCAEAIHTVQLNMELGDYTWSNGVVGSELIATESDLYSVTLTYACGVVEDSFNLIIGDGLDGLEDLDLNDNTVFCEGTLLPIDLSNLLLDSILWNDGSVSAERLLGEPGSYSIKMTNACVDTIISFELMEEFCPQETVYIPNVFSPNNDGVNDYFSIGYAEDWPPPSIKFSVYDRWGELVFYSEDPNFQWFGDFKGESLGPDVFVFYYELEVELNGKMELLNDSGDITILR
jgi:gliding motility-associated-like protein